ncbi:Ubiquinone biosynthesis protein coq4, mitochondrial [Smittium culicis]|uniref:Ubiquinone biosynthesis protein coq4, mitochondrial n=1 Tax=Smittium culicis TaxID=133412 RepID=A0A1R1YKH2_9FUNG|nr:Ubiquinone biosynthesis protein coq4, mitochondrial [Smittium culicis]
MLASSSGRQVLKDRPVLDYGPADLARFRAMPANTLGRAYFDFMARYGLDSGGRPPTRFVESARGDSAELAYVMTRYRQSHDFYHVVLNKSISIVDELAIKYYEHLQTGLPVGLVAALAGQSRLSNSEYREFWSVLVPWAHMAASSSSNDQMLINVYWEKHIEDDVDQLRRSLNVFI